LKLRDFFTLPALAMFTAGVFLAAWVRSLLGRARSKVGGG
jgi:hypothetical protein